MNVRVHELASELGMTNAEMLFLCDKLGVPAKSHLSSLNEAYADMVRRRAERDGLTRDEQPAELGRKKKPAKKEAKKRALVKKVGDLRVDEGELDDERQRKRLLEIIRGGIGGPAEVEEWVYPSTFLAPFLRGDYDDQFNIEGTPVVDLLHALPRVGRKGFGVDKAKRIQGIMSTVGIEDLCTVGQLGSKQRQALLELVDDWY